MVFFKLVSNVLLHDFTPLTLFYIILACISFPLTNKCVIPHMGVNHHDEAFFLCNEMLLWIIASNPDIITHQISSNDGLKIYGLKLVARDIQTDWVWDMWQVLHLSIEVIVC